MNHPTSGVCHNCGDRLITWWRWRHIPATERAHLRATGHNRKGTNDECDRCRQGRWRNEQPRPDRKYRTREEVLSDWEFLVDHTKTMNRNVHELAPRMGMTVTALSKALDRAGVRAWPVVALGWADRDRDEWAS